MPNGTCRCGAALPASRAKNPRRWCSESCRVKHYRLDNATKVREQARQSLAHSRDARRQARVAHHQCDHCNADVFHSLHRTCGAEECKRKQRTLRGRRSCARQRARGAECITVSNARRRARMANAYVADIDRNSVFNRDHWRCHICKGKIKPDKHKHPHPLSPSIDHLIPLAAGGTHEPANVAAAHLGCNSSKGARGAGEQLALIG